MFTSLYAHIFYWLMECRGTLEIHSNDAVRLTVCVDLPCLQKLVHCSWEDTNTRDMNILLLLSYNADVCLWKRNVNFFPIYLS